jgi:Cu-processing system permease protein
MADAGLVLCISAGLGGRPIGLVIGLGAGSVALLAAAAWRWPVARTFGPIPWAAALLLIGAVLASNAPDERRVVLAAATLTLLEVGIVTAIATLFSSFSTPFLSALLTVGLFVVGREADSLARLPVKYFGRFIHDAGVVLAKVVPNLQIYVPPRPLLTGEAIEPRLSTYLAWAALNGLGWAIGLLVLATLIFRKRDFL